MATITTNVELRNRIIEAFQDKKNKLKLSSIIDDYIVEYQKNISSINDSMIWEIEL